METLVAGPHADHLSGPTPEPTPDWMLQIPREMPEVQPSQPHAKTETETPAVDPSEPLCGPTPEPMPEWMLQPIPPEMPQPTHPHAETPAVDLPETFCGPTPEPMPEWIPKPIPQEELQPTQPHAGMENPAVDPPPSEPLSGPTPGPMPKWMLEPIPLEMPQPTPPHPTSPAVDLPLWGPMPEPMPEWVLQPVPREMLQTAKIIEYTQDTGHDEARQRVDQYPGGPVLAMELSFEVHMDIAHVVGFGVGFFLSVFSHVLSYSAFTNRRLGSRPRPTSASVPERGRQSMGGKRRECLNQSLQIKYGHPKYQPMFCLFQV